MVNGIELCNQRARLLTATGNILVEGGPGSGKTTIALLKAKKIIESSELLAGQKVLFLSFARATTSRVLEQARNIAGTTVLDSVEVNTYHGFCWTLIKTYGYLINGQRNTTIITPADVANLLANFNGKENHAAELRRLYFEEGKIGFDLFATIAGELLSRSKRIRSIVCSCYPVLIVDEFQDTNDDEWKIVSTLGSVSKIVALADPEQRIYDFRGSDPSRISEFRSIFLPHEFHFERQNYRSGETDIVEFGDRVLSGRVDHYEFDNVEVVYYANKRPLFSELNYKVIQSVRRLSKNNSSSWSIAILVKTQAMMLKISRALSSPVGSLPTVNHEVLVDPMGPALSANIIADLLDSEDDAASNLDRLLNNLVKYLRGCKGSKPTQQNLKLADAFSAYLSSGGTLRGRNRLKTLESGRIIVGMCSKLEFSGVPADDWLAVRNVLKEVANDTWTKVYNDAKYISLLRKGKRLAQDLGLAWRENGCYKGARLLVQKALEQEYFEAPQRYWKGVYVMTMHKSKGKEFDEVFLVEDTYGSRFFRDFHDQGQFKSDAYVLRVGVTRAKQKVTILTPRHSYCNLLGPPR